MSSFVDAAGRFALFPGPRGPLPTFDERDPDESDREPGDWLLARMLWLVCTAVAAFGCIYAAYFLSIGLVHAVVGSLMCVAAGALAMAYARRTGHHREALEAVCVLLFAMLAVTTLFQDGLRSPALCWLAAVPLIAVLAGSTGLGVVLGALFVVQVAWLRAHPEPLTSLSLLATDRSFQLALSMSLSALFVGVCIALGSHWARELRGAIERGRTAALAALAAKARFVSQVSHEIRTPLQGLIGATEMLAEPGLATDRRDLLVDVQRQSAGMLAALVNDILDFSKLEAGKVRLEQRPIDLAAMLLQIREFFAPQACDKGLELTSSASPDVPRLLLGDATRLRQIITNLVANAIKFTAQGSVHIHLGLAGHGHGDASGAQRGMRVRIEVADSGLGIEADMIDLLFKPFHQADETITRRFGGTGLGLSIADDLARLMGGHIEVSSAPGRGSTFALVVPLKLPEGTAARLLTPRRGRALVATATHDVSSHLKGLLEDLGIDSESVSEVPDAGAARSARAGFVFLDSTLLHGPLAEARRRLDELSASGVKVVVVSPFGSEPVVGTATGTFLVYTPVRRASLEALLDEAGQGVPPARVLTPASASRRAGGDGSPGEVRPAALPPGLVVLVAEDDPANQAVIAAMLDFLQVTTLVASNGREALALLRSRRVDVVLMDLHMPELDGIETTRLLRAHESAGGSLRTAVIAATGSTEPATVTACLAAGMDAVLAKPFALPELRRRLGEVIAARANAPA